MTVTEGAVIKEPGSSVKNKTGLWRTFRPVVTEKCTGCRMCELNCPDSSIKIVDNRAVIDYEHCKGCLICMELCPLGAIKKEIE